MREGVVVSAIFFLFGLLFIIAGIKVMPEIFYMKHIAMLAGLLLMLFSPLILIGTFLVSVTPGAKEKLDKCEH